MQYWSQFHKNVIIELVFFCAGELHMCVCVCVCVCMCVCACACVYACVYTAS